MRRPYSVLLPVGFAMPFPLPEMRCALTAPFRPGPPWLSRKRVVYFLWHFPLPPPSRAQPDVIRHRSSLEPGLSSPIQRTASQRPPDPLARLS